MKSVSPSLGKYLKDDTVLEGKTVVIPGWQRKIAGCVCGFGLGFAGFFLISLYLQTWEKVRYFYSEKANNKCRVVVGVKPGEEGSNHMVASLDTQAKSLYLVQKAKKNH